MRAARSEYNSLQLRHTQRQGSSIVGADTQAPTSNNKASEGSSNRDHVQQECLSLRLAEQHNRLTEGDRERVTNLALPFTDRGYGSTARIPSRWPSPDTNTAEGVIPLLQPRPGVFSTQGNNLSLGRSRGWISAGRRSGLRSTTIEP